MLHRVPLSCIRSCNSCLELSSCFASVHSNILASVVATNSHVCSSTSVMHVCAVLLCKDYLSVTTVLFFKVSMALH